MASPRAASQPGPQRRAVPDQPPDAAVHPLPAPPEPSGAPAPRACGCFGPRRPSFAQQLAADAALLRAAAVGHVSTLTAALAAGANLRASDKLGDTAMHEAARNGHVSCLEALLDAGAETSHPNQRGYTPLHYAAHSGHSGAVAALLDAGADVAARVHVSGWTPLHLAASRRKAAAAAALVRLGADPLGRADDGVTPYSLAADDADMVAALTPAPRAALVALVFSVPPAAPLRAARGGRVAREAARLAHDAALRRRATGVANALRKLPGAAVALLQQPTAEQLAEAVVALAPPQLSLAQLAAQQEQLAGSAGVK